MSEVLLLRHPQSQHNASGHWAGWIDSPLTTQGRGEACDAAKRLAQQQHRAIVSSDLQRAAESASIISALLRIPHIAVDPRWRERNAGDWQGQEVAKLDSENFHAWRRDPTSPIPGGEEYESFRLRLFAALNDSSQWAHQYGALIVIAHDGVQQAICRDLSLPYPYPALHGPRIILSQISY